MALYLKDADVRLTQQISWLHGESDLRGSSIRAVEANDFAAIINAARRAAAQPMSAGDTASIILRQSEDGVLPLRQIYE